MLRQNLQLVQKADHKVMLRQCAKSHTGAEEAGVQQETMVRGS